MGTPAEQRALAHWPLPKQADPSGAELVGVAATINGELATQPALPAPPEDDGSTSEEQPKRQRRSRAAAVQRSSVLVGRRARSRGSSGPVGHAHGLGT